MAAPTGNQIGLEAVFNTTQYQKGLDTYLRGLQQANQSTEKAGGVMGSLGRIIETGIGTAIGYLTATVIPALVNGLVDIVKGAIGATAELQNLTIMLETLAAKELVQAGVTDNMGDALGLAKDRAQAMLAALRDLSVTSPFEYKDVVSVYRLNLAFGQGSDMAMKLTGAILDMAAGMGLSGQFLERIAYNFSQMSLVGKVTMRDIRDLAMAGVDLAGVFKGELGMSIEQVNEALLAGKITMQDVSQAFVDYAEKNFGGAAQRMSRTLSGLQSSFRDLMFFASVDVFGPAAQVVADGLGKIFDRANQLVQSGALQVIGAALEVLARQFFDEGADIVQATEQTADETIARWQQWALDAATYGSNIMISFANGIYAGATAVLNALLYIGNLISSWLSPGSPPRLLPDLPKWGMSAMTEFLEGMTKADFDVLTGIQGPLEEALRMMVQTGEMTQGEMGAILADLSTQLAEALSTGGDLGAGFFDAMMEAAGPFGAELADLINLSMDLAAATAELTAAEEAAAAATEAVQAAEAALEAARDRQKASRTELNKSKLEYNALVRGGASAAELAAAMERIQAAEAEATAADEAAAAAEDSLGLAQDQEETAQDNLDAIQAQVDAMQELVSLQDELLQQLLALMQAQIEMPEMAPAGAAGGAAPATTPTGGPALPTIPPFELPELDLSGFVADMTAIFDDLKKKINRFEVDFLTVWFRLFGVERGTLTTAARDAWERISTNLQGYINIWKGWWDEHGASVMTVLQAIADLIAKIDWPTLGKAVSDFGQYLQDVFTEDQAGKIAILGDAFDLLAGIIEGDKKKMGTSLGELIADLINYRTWNQIIFDDVKLAVQGVIDRIAIGWHLFWTDMFTTAHEKALEIWTAIVTKFEEIKASIGITLTAIGIVWEEKWTAAKTFVETKWTEIQTAVATAIGDVKTTIDTKIGEITTSWETFWKNVRTFVDGVFNGQGGIVGLISTAWTSIQKTLEAWLAKVNALIAAIKKLLGLDTDDPTIGTPLRGPGTTTTLPDRVTKIPSVPSTPISYPIARQPIMMGSSSTRTFNMGGVNIYNKIDAAAFESWMRRIIREELK